MYPCCWNTLTPLKYHPAISPLELMAEAYVPKTWLSGTLKVVIVPSEVRTNPASATGTQTSSPHTLFPAEPAMVPLLLMPCGDVYSFDGTMMLVIAPPFGFTNP